MVARARRLLLDTEARFIEALREAAERLRRGLIPVSFPGGAFPPSMRFERHAEICRRQGRDSPHLEIEIGQPALAVGPSCVLASIPAADLLAPMFGSHENWRKLRC